MDLIFGTVEVVREEDTKVDLTRGNVYDFYYGLVSDENQMCSLARYAATSESASWTTETRKFSNKLSQRVSAF